MSIRGRPYEIDERISLEHGRGRNLLWMSQRPEIPISYFHYELGTLAEIGTFALGFGKAWNDSLEVLSSGVFIDRSGKSYWLQKLSNHVLETQSVSDRRGETIQVPCRWIMEGKGPSIYLKYETIKYFGSFAGMGRLCNGGALIQADVRFKKGKTVFAQGSVFQEHSHQSNFAS
ncbi:hypothetical protein WDW89_21700 [Deltaproteobacteria bacterium TL4]